MSGEGSEAMLNLLKELSVYKAMDEDDRARPMGRSETEAHADRERRRQTIKQEMHKLAAESENDPA